MNEWKKHQQIIDNKIDKKVIQLYKNKSKVRTIAKITGISYMTVYRILKNKNIFISSVKKWTPKEEKWLIENAPFRGSKYCTKYLKKTYHQIKHKCQELKITASCVDFKYDVKSEIIRLYTIEKLTSAAIERRVHHDKGFIKRVLEKAGVYKFPFKNPIHKWTIKSINQLKQLYPFHTLKECSKIMNIPAISLAHQVSKSKIKKIYQDPVNMKLFKKISLPEVAYFLGFFYADGSIKNKTNRIVLTIIKDDAIIIKPTLNKIINFRYYEYDKSHMKRKDIGTFNINSKGLWKFLYENDYFYKSERSACKILNKIPENLHYMFFRGFLDGDGCIALDKIKNRGRVSFSGSYNQDWKFLEKLCRKLKIKYVINRNLKLKGHKNSNLVISNFENTLVLLNYIYKQYQINQIGLTRKYKKYIKLIAKCQKYINNMGGIDYSPTSLKKYRVTISKKPKKILLGGFETFNDAFIVKMNFIKKYRSREYILRKLINYWNIPTKKFKYELANFRG